MQELNRQYKYILLKVSKRLNTFVRQDISWNLASNDNLSENWKRERRAKAYDRAKKAALYAASSRKRRKEVRRTIFSFQETGFLLFARDNTTGLHCETSSRVAKAAPQLPQLFQQSFDHWQLTLATHTRACTQTGKVLMETVSLRQKQLGIVRVYPSQIETISKYCGLVHGKPKHDYFIIHRGTQW